MKSVKNPAENIFSWALFDALAFYCYGNRYFSGR